MGPEKLKIAILCRTSLFAEGLQRILEGEEDFDVLGALTGPAAFEEIVRMNSDVVLSDLDSFASYAKERMPQLKKKILLIETPGHTSFQSRITEMISAGVVGILPHYTDSSNLTKAIKTVCAGELWINQKILKAIITGQDQKKIGTMTRQESKIGRYICRGLRNKEIARELNITEQTVKSHCNRMFKKLGVSDRLQLALLLVNEGFGNRA